MIYRYCSEHHSCVDHKYLNSELLLLSLDVIYHLYIVFLL